MNDLTGYELSRDWFDFCFENPDKISPTHTAMYFFIIEHCNRLGWKEKFGLPMEMTKDAIGIKNYRTFTNTFNDLVEWGFIKVIQKSKNQYSSNIIAIVKNTIASTKALDKAMQKQLQKQVHGIVGIDKPLNQELLTIKQEIPLNPQGEISKKNIVDTFLESVDDNWKPIVKTWLDYKKEKGQKYRGSKSLNVMFKNLKEISNNSPATAEKIITKSIASNWSGLFPLKEEKSKHPFTAELPMDYKEF
jgi:hypothetical protein